MTKEQIEKCKPFEQALNWAVRSNFLHLRNTEFNQIAAIYKEVFGEGLTIGQMTCNTCRLTAMKRLGNEYNKAIQEIALEEAKERKEAVVQPAPKKRTGRKKKIDIE